MSLLALSATAGLLPFLLVLACPLIMVFMMRDMHGGRGQAGHGDRGPSSLEELKAERDRLNEEIGRRAEETAAR